MTLQSLSLQSFRSYTKRSFTFDKTTTVVVGPNTSGKSNLIEAIYLLASGKSFRAEKDIEMIQFEKDFARVVGIAKDSSEHEVKLEVTVVNSSHAHAKKLKVNDVPKRRVDFAGRLFALLFIPSDLDIIVSSPSLRRSFLDRVLEMVDSSYRQALSIYTKAIRQRNALLESHRETGMWDKEQLAYWDNILIENGQLIIEKREVFLQYVNGRDKDLLHFMTIYDKSTISHARLAQYADAEIAAGVTLVGPHRDDFSVHLFDKTKQAMHDIRHFGSRGQQRLAVLQLKLLQLSYMEEKLGVRPMLLLDDIFSELDARHIHLVTQMFGKQQTILTTTHREFLKNATLKNMTVIELSQA